jgi:hypothetical protein
MITRSMRKPRSVALFLTAVMVLSVLGAVPVAAQPQWSASGGSASASPGDTGVQVTFGVENSGDEIGSAEVTVQNGSLPSGWSVTDLEANDPNPADFAAVIPNPPTYVFSDVDPGETVTVTATVDVPDGAAVGDYTLNATVENVSSGTQIGTPSSTISVSETDAGPFGVSNLSPANPTAGPGDQVTVSADITNQGSVAGDTEARLIVDGSQEASTTLTDISENGGSQTATFDFQAPSSTGTYSWSIETDDDSASGSLTVTDAGPFTIANTPDLQPAAVAPGGVVTVTVDITNAGGAPGSTTAQVSTPWGASASTTTPSIAAGATQQVSLVINAPSTEAAYSIDVSTTDASESVTLTVDALAPYLGGQGTVQTSGLTIAIDDWRNGEIDTGMLITVINEWRSAN